MISIENLNHYSELSCIPDLIRYTSDDSIYPFPEDYCFLYALAYRRGLVSRKDLIDQKFPPVWIIKSRLLKERGRIAFDKLDQFDKILKAEPNSFVLEDDIFFDCLPICGCHSDMLGYSFILPQISDLLLVQFGTTWHFYFNPMGTPKGDHLGITLPGFVGGKGGNNKKKPQNVKSKKVIEYVVKEPKREVVQVVNKPKKKKQANKITKAGNFLREMGSIAGSWLGSEKLGRSVGAGISRIFGQGDYKIQANSLMTGGPPSFSPLNAGIRITHREYLGDVFGTIGYNVVTHRIQPNSPGTFPWLHQLASSFEQYKMNGMVAYLNSTSGNAVSSTNNALGVWGITTVYDPSKPALSTKIQAEEYNGCTAGVPSCSILHPIECKPKSDVLERYYVDVNNNITGEDLKFYDLGKINVFTQGQQQDGVNLGELWISYDITFFNPRIQPIGEDNQSDHYAITSDQVISSIYPFGSVPGNAFPTSGSSLGTFIQRGTLAPNNTCRLYLPRGSTPGVYLFMYSFYGGTTTSTTIDANITPTSANVSNYNLFRGSSSHLLMGYGPGSAAVSSFTIMETYMKTDTEIATITFSASNLPSVNSGTVCDILVVPLGQAITLAMAKLTKEEELVAMIEKILKRKSSVKKVTVSETTDFQVLGE